MKSELTEAWLQPAGSELLEVTVTGFRQRMKTIPGGFEYDPKDLIKNSTDFASVVAKVPMVEYKDGVASILGKGKSELYLNGRLIIADPELVAMTFKSWPPSMIKKVEIILAPGASFNSSSGAGIVNIITVDIYEGWLGSARASVSLNNGRPAPQIEAGGSYSGKKFNVSALVLLASDGFPLKSNSRYDFHTTGTTIETSTKDRGHSERLRALFSAGYSFSSRTRLEGRLSISGNSAHSTYNSRSLRREADGSVTESFSDRVMRRPFRAPGVDLGLALFQKFGPKGYAGGPPQYTTPDRQPESVCRSDRLLPLPAGKSHSAPAAVL